MNVATVLVFIIITSLLSVVNCQADEDASALATDCALCVSLVGLTQSLVRSDNATTEEIMQAAVNICYQLVPHEGWNPDTLCDLIIDTYAPHVIYILNVTDKSPAEICSLYNHCDDVTLIEPPPIKYKQRAIMPGIRTSAVALPDDYPSAIRLVHLGDIHTDYLYAEESATTCDMPLCCRNDSNGNGSARYWGEYQCNIPHRTVDLMFNFIAQQFQPDIITYTGDTVQHTVWDQPFEQTVEVSQYITERIAYFFPATPAYYAIGNHDSCPTNLYHAGRTDIQELNSAMFNHWKSLSRFGPEQQSTFERGAYYSTTVGNLPGLRILSYNSLYGALENYYNILNVDGSDYSDMKTFMENTLATARVNNEQIIMLGHHPSGSSGYIQEYSEFITDIHARYSDIIVLHLLGHSHGDNFKLVRDLSTNNTVGVQISGPSMTSYTDINPSVRVYYLDPVTFEPLDMDTYHLDLNSDAGNPAAQLKFVYRATMEYNMTDLSAQAFDDFVNRMEADRSLMELYLYNQDTRVFEPWTCDDSCAHSQLCDLRYTDYTRRQECLNSPL